VAKPSRIVIGIAGIKEVLKLVDSLAPPHLTPSQRKRLVNAILSLLGDTERVTRMTPELLGELVRIHAQCVLNQKGKCALTIFLQPLCWEINQALGLANEEDAAFRRADPMCAAKPLTARFNSEE